MRLEVCGETVGDFGGGRLRAARMIRNKRLILSQVIVEQMICVVLRNPEKMFRDLIQLPIPSLFVYYGEQPSPKGSKEDLSRKTNGRPAHCASHRSALGIIKIGNGLLWLSHLQLREIKAVLGNPSQEKFHDAFPIAFLKWGNHAASCIGCLSAERISSFLRQIILSKSSGRSLSEGNGSPIVPRVM